MTEKMLLNPSKHRTAMLFGVFPSYHLLLYLRPLLPGLFCCTWLTKLSCVMTVVLVHQKGFCHVQVLGSYTYLSLLYRYLQLPLLFVQVASTKHCDDCAAASSYNYSWTLFSCKLVCLATAAACVTGLIGSRLW